MPIYKKKKTADLVSESTQAPWSAGRRCRRFNRPHFTLLLNVERHYVRNLRFNFDF